MSVTPAGYPLYRRSAVLMQSRALDQMWAGYLKQLDKDERPAWRDAFGRIQEGRRGGISPGSVWFEIMRRGLEDKLGRGKPEKIN